MRNLAVAFTLVSLGIAAPSTQTQSQAQKKKHTTKSAGSVSRRASTRQPPRKTVTRKHAPAVHRVALKRPVAPVTSLAIRQADLGTVERRLRSLEPALENAAALVPFFALLNETHATGKPVHILQFGDSHTASDDWVDAMRIELQARYGVGGPGFVLPGSPFRGYRRFDVKGNSSEGWLTEGTVAHPGDGVEGLSGVSITAHSAGQVVTLRTSCDALAIHYLQQPNGGGFEFFVDGQLVDTVSTRGETAAGIYRYQPLPGEHEYRLRTVSDYPVRLFGWSSDERTGLTFETLGINGAQVHVIDNWNLPVWQQEVASRNPALVVLEYGTNEANNPRWSAEQYTADLREALARVRQAAPLASILMIGPPDCGRSAPLPHLSEVVAIERHVAKENHVAIWNWRERMGGPRSVVEWVRAGLGQPDYVHLTGTGYRTIGKALIDDLEAQHALFNAAMPRPADDQTNPPPGVTDGTANELSK